VSYEFNKKRHLLTKIYTYTYTYTYTDTDTDIYIYIYIYRATLIQLY